MEKYNKGDHVKIDDDYSNGFSYEGGEQKPILSEEAGKEAIVIGSYSDLYGAHEGVHYTISVNGEPIDAIDDYDFMFSYENSDKKPLKEKTLTGATKTSVEDYKLHIKDVGNVSWFPEDALTLISENCMGKLEEWERERDAEIKLKSNLDWIFENGNEVIEKPHGASMQALANCCGLIYLWGPKGEGIVYYDNVIKTLKLAKPFLMTGNKQGWLDRCENLSFIDKDKKLNLY